MKRLSGNIDKIIKDINISFEKSLSGSVSEYVVEKVNQKIKTDVYGAYKPQVYKRKFMLYEDRNHNKEIEKSIDGVSLRYYHRA